MNIVELRDRLTAIIEENITRFPKENRNQQPMFVHYYTSKRVHSYAPVKYAEGSLYSFTGSDKHGFAIQVDEDNKIEYGRNRKLATEVTNGNS